MASRSRRDRTHLIDKITGGSVCGEDGPASYNTFDCDECTTILQRYRRERRIVAEAQEQANKLIRKRKARIARYEERRRHMPSR